MAKNRAQSELLGIVVAVGLKSDLVKSCCCNQK